MADPTIQNAFLDGIEEIFSIMFTDRLQLSLLNEEATQTNIYEETPNKVYLDPIQLIGRIQTTFTQGENPVESVQIDAIITIPTKQLITHQIPHLTDEDLETLASLLMMGLSILLRKSFQRPLLLISGRCTVLSVE